MARTMEDKVVADMLRAAGGGTNWAQEVVKASVDPNNAWSFSEGNHQQQVPDEVDEH